MTVVARLRTLRASTARDYVVRGVVPLPNDFELDTSAGAPSPLTILDRGGAAVLTQCQPVTSIAGGRVTSVELSAIVRAAPSGSARYDVVAVAPGAAGAPGDERTPEAARGVAEPGVAARALLDAGLVLYAYDAQDELHTARVRRDACGQCDREGPIVCTRMDAGALRVSDHAQTARGNAFLGFNAWLTWSHGSDVVLLDLFVHNAHTGRKSAREVYFRQLGLLLAKAWTWESLWPMPSIAAPFLVRELAEQCHVVVQRHGLVFRLVLFREEDREAAQRLRANEGWAVCEPGDDLWSWHSARCGFGPHQLPLPELQGLSERELADDPRPWSVVRDALAAGGDGNGPWKTFGTHPMSPYLPWGSFQGGMTSGTEIHACEGAKLAWTGAPDQLSAWFAAQKMYADRCPVWLIDPTTALPARDELYPGREPGWVVGATAEFTQGEEAWGFTPRERALDPGKLPRQAPDYLAPLSRYGTIDLAHFTRVTSKFLVPALLDNDPLSKFGLRMFGELAFMFGQRRIVEFEAEARAQPGRGGFMTRISGWTFHAMASAALLGGERERARMAPFVDRLSAGLAAAIMPNGHVHAQTDGRLGDDFEGRYAVNNGIALGIAPNGQFTLARAVANAPARALLIDLIVRQAIGMRELRWRPGHAGIITRVGVWRKPNGAPFRTLQDLPEDALEDKESNFYSAILLGLALWCAPENETLLEAFDDFVASDPQAFFAHRNSHEILGSLGWLWSWWQRHAG